MARDLATYIYGNTGWNQNELEMRAIKDGLKESDKNLYLRGTDGFCYKSGPLHDRKYVGENFDKQSGHTFYFIHCQRCGRGLNQWNDE